MKPIYILSILLIFIVACNSKPTTDQAEENIEIEVDETETVDKNTKNERKSPRIQKSVQENGMDIAFDYGSPRVKDRIIWGDLVPFDKVWRAGADEVSAVTFNNDVILGDSLIPSGTYGMFIIPKEKEDWTFILNEEWSKEKHDVWGAYDYKEDKDVLRLNIPADQTKTLKEELKYDYDPENEQIIFEWEYIRLEVPVATIEPA